MDKIPVSKFKATCAAVLDDVERTGRTVTITKRGKPIAEITRPAPTKSVADLLGCMAGEIEIVGDIVNSPWTAEELDEIEAEWLKNWDEIEAKGQANLAKHRQEAKRTSKPKRQKGGKPAAAR